MDLATEAAKFGPYAFILVVVLLSIGVAGRWVATWVDSMQARQDERNAKQQMQLVEVIQSAARAVDNNTIALRELCATNTQSVDELQAHDKRAEVMQADVRTILATTSRIEQKIDGNKNVK